MSSYLTIDVNLPKDEEITIYKQGEWLDLCRGPHLPTTKHVGKSFKLMKVAGAYWRGNENNNKESIEIVEEISLENGGSKFKWAKTTEERNKLWQARHDVYYSVKAEQNNIKVYTTDICVPISNLVEAIIFAEIETGRPE